MRFQKGQSGNPAGRPRGIIDERVRARRAIQAVADYLPSIAANIAKASQFLLFTGLENSPVGGWNDYRGEFASLDQATEAGREFLNAQPVLGWWHVVSAHDGEIVARERNTWGRDDLDFGWEDED